VRTNRLQPLFVADIPDVLEEGVVYLALAYDAMVHLCACGCGREVSTPIGPTDWKISWNGEALSVWPSVGNGALSCRSHYIIDAGRVRWCPNMTDQDIADERRRTAIAKGQLRPPSAPVQTVEVAPPSPPLPQKPWSVRLLQWLVGKPRS